MQPIVTSSSQKKEDQTRHIQNYTSMKQASIYLNDESTPDLDSKLPTEITPKGSSMSKYTENGNRARSTQKQMS